MSYENPIGWIASFPFWMSNILIQISTIYCNRFWLQWGANIRSQKSIRHMTPREWTQHKKSILHFSMSYLIVNETTKQCLYVQRFSSITNELRYLENFKNVPENFKKSLNILCVFLRVWAIWQHWASPQYGFKLYYYFCTLFKILQYLTVFLIMYKKY